MMKTTGNFGPFLYMSSTDCNGDRNCAGTTYIDITGQTIEGGRSVTEAFLNQASSLADLGVKDFAILVGSEEDTDEYKWEHDISTLTNAGRKLSRENRDGHGVMRITQSYCNDTDTDISVKQMALVYKAYFTEKVIVLAKEVFDSEIVIKSRRGTHVRYRYWITEMMRRLSQLCTLQQRKGAMAC